MRIYISRAGWRVPSLLLWLFVALIAVTLILSATPVEGAMQPAAESTETGAGDGPLARPDTVSAALTARSTGRQVEVEDLRDEFSSTWANPDGTMTTKLAAAPIRQQDESGEWIDIDLEYVEQSDGTVAAKEPLVEANFAGEAPATTEQVEIAEGVAVAAVTESTPDGQPDHEVALGWSEELTAPEVEGETVVYPEVEPGVDMVIESRRSGFEQNFVIQSAEALAQLQADRGDEPISWVLPLAAAGVTPREEEDGSVSLVDAEGQVASRFETAFAWDAEVDERSGDPASPSLVDLSVEESGDGQWSLTVTPDQEWLNDPEREFPITVDPTYASGSAKASFDTYVSKSSPNTSFASATELKVGTHNGGGEVARSFIWFPLSAIRGKDIIYSVMSLHETWSYSCSPRTMYIMGSPGTGTGLTWNNQPHTLSYVGELSFAKGFSSSCPAGRLDLLMTSLVQQWSTVPASTSEHGRLRLHASETDSYGWKKFASSETSNPPMLLFTYNRPPNTPALPTLKAPAVSYAPPNGTAEIFTSDTRPVAETKATDADGSRVKYDIQFHNSTAGNAASLKASCTTGSVASGALASCRPPSALAAGKYFVRAKAVDERGKGGGWTGYTAFTIANGTPPAPKITCPAPYSNGSWHDNRPGANVTCTISAAGTSGNTALPGSVELTIDGVKKPAVKVTPSTDPNVAKTTVTFAANADGPHSIHAVAISRANVRSAAGSYSFGWGGAALSLPSDKTSTSGKVAVTAGAPPRGAASSVTAKLRWRVSAADDETAGWTDGPDLPVTSESATSPVTVKSTWDTQSAVQESGADSSLPTRVPVTLDVQVCFTYAGVSSPQCTWSQSPVTVTRVPHAFGNGYPVTQAGPGQAALFTGEFNTSATDVSVPGYASDLAISRSHSTFAGDGTIAGWPSDPVSGAFGPGWTAAFEGPEAGAAGYTVADNTLLDGTIAFIDDEGEPLVFQNPDGKRAYKQASYVPVTVETVEAGARMSIEGSGAGMSLRLVEEDGTVTTWQPIAFTASKPTEWKPVSVAEPGQHGTTTYGHDAAGRVTRIVAAVPAGMQGSDCPTAGALARGCRAMDIEYATTTTATASQPGDVKGQVRQITAQLWDPATEQMTATPVATYAYDHKGRLVSVTDPRTDLTTRYTWQGDTSTLLSSVAEPGLAPHKLHYSLLGKKLVKVDRGNPAGEGADVTVARFVYGVPTSGAGLPDVSADGVAAWHQAKTPAEGYAVFGQDYTGPTEGDDVDWSYADLQYTDELGYTVNTASFGAGAWQITATDYDSRGNTVRELDAGAIASVLADDEPLAKPQVDAMSTQTFYNADIVDAAGKVVTEAGTLVTDVVEPSRNAALADGTVIPVRPHTHTTYDEGAPNQVDGVGINPATEQPYRLATSITTGVIDAAVAINGEEPLTPLEISSVTTNVYDKVDAGDAAEGSGWDFGTPTRVTTGGITRTTRIDTEGRTIETRQPLSDGNDAGTTRTHYYTAAAHHSDPACGHRPEWAGLTCHAFPAAPPSAGAAGAQTMPATRTTAYGKWLGVTETVETSASATRTTATTHDDAGREIATTTTSTIGGSASRPGTFTRYDPASGLVAYTGELDHQGSDADPNKRISSTYDAWGRLVSHTNDLGDLTTTVYDAAGRVQSVSDPKGTVTYTYDGTDAEGNRERRGKVTGLAVTRDSDSSDLSFGAAYDADGNMTIQTMPGQIVQKTLYDEAGEPVSLEYHGPVTEVVTETDPETLEQTYVPGETSIQPWLAWSTVNDGQGRVRAEMTGVGAAFDGVTTWDPATGAERVLGSAAAYSRLFSYDEADRLASVVATTADPNVEPGAVTPCSQRTYGFDANGRRTIETSNTFASGVCGEGAAASTTIEHGYDTADRPTSGADGQGQYAYDDFGRQVSLPAADAPDPILGDITLGYYDDDLPRTISQGDTTTTYQLDVADRRSISDVSTTGGGQVTTRRHYTDDSDNPAWIDVMTGGVTTTTRFVESIGGDLGLQITVGGATKLSLANMHGDTVTTIDIGADAATAAAGIDAWADYLEYGTPRDRQAAQTVGGPGGYGWLGAKQRSTPAEAAGLTLMGVRLYNPVTGLFTSPDPIPGGNDTTYAYPADPINKYDLTGKAFWIPLAVACVRYCRYAAPAVKWGAKKLAKKAGKGVGTRKTKVWARKYPSGGGGVGINRNGKNVFRGGKSNWKHHGKQVTGIRKYSVHYGRNASQRSKHRPWQGGWRR